MIKNPSLGSLMVSAAMTAAALLTVPAQAEESATQQAAPDPNALRICAAANEEPFSSRSSTGFENRIAAAVAQAMGRKPEFVWYDKPGIYLVRDQLDQNACDVVLGIDTGDDRVLTSTPYFRAPYVFVQKANSPLDIKSWDSPDLMKAGKIGFDQDTPAQVMLQELHLFGANFNYMKSLTDFKSRRNQYVRIEPTRMIGEVANGTADLAIAFAPEVARYVKEKAGELKMTVIPATFKRSDGMEVAFHYDQSIGVRKDDGKLRDEINAAIDKARPEIEAILKDEGIPPVSIGTAGSNAG